MKPLFYLLAASVFLSSAEVLAHKVNMFAFAEGDQVFVEGYFSDGKRARESEVVVFDRAGRELLKGITDDEGSFVFKIPVQEDLRITLNAGMGHKTEYLIPRAELAGMGDEMPAAEVSGKAPLAADAGVSSPAGVSAPAAGISEAALRKAVGEAIRPLMRSISELQERRSFSDIVGGIGFIIGIAGVYFYLKARRMLQAGDKDQR